MVEPLVPVTRGEHDMVRDRVRDEFNRLLAEMDNVLDLVAQQAAKVVEEQTQHPKEAD